MVLPPLPRRLRIGGLIDRSVGAIAVPSLFALALDPVLSAVDTAFVGRLADSGGEQLAALAVGSTALALSSACLGFLATASTPLIASVAAERGEPQALQLSVRILSLAAVVGVAALVALEAGAPTIVDAMGGDSGGFFDTALAVVRVRALSAPALALQAATAGALRATGDARSSLRADDHSELRTT